MSAKARRSYGTGSLYVRTDARGREVWYGRWYVDSTRIKRRIGPKRRPGEKTGLSQPQAESELRRLIESEEPRPAASTVTIALAGERMLRHLEALGRKPTTLITYRSILHTHIQSQSRLGDVPIKRASPETVEGLIATMQRDGKAPKTIANTVTLLSQIFAFARRRGWCRENPCERVDRPQLEPNVDIRFLDPHELEALLGAVDVEAEPFGQTDQVMFLTAAMTGLRQGELLALRWRDIDWRAARIRVRRNHVRGHWGTPKSRRGSRSVPLADRVGGELDLHFKRSAYRADDDLVFADPRSGEVLNHSTLVRRFKTALTAAGVRSVRFHDLRHTFGTRMAAAGVPMRTLQEWMGHRDIKTTLIYVDYAPSEHEGAMVQAAFAGDEVTNESAERETRPRGSKAQQAATEHRGAP